MFTSVTAYNKPARDGHPKGPRRTSALLQPLAIHRDNVPLHEQAGQNQDIFCYINRTYVPWMS
jgi:hypothetical protein